MAENNDNLVIEHLRYIRARVDKNENDMADIKMRLSSVERSNALLHLDIAQVNYRLDGFDKRLGTIENRLELKTITNPQDSSQ
jgi:predicted  nucleic acid-binding Zn-ribbon protein